jgi:CotH kinase protein
VMKRYIERNFHGNMKGNLYELEHHDDFLEERLKFIGVESLSKFEDKADLKFACRHIKADGLAGADQMLDMDQFLKIYAMEFFLKHWDGYADNTNNTYIYNDVTAVAAPGVGNIKFKMIPWGIDQTLQPDRPFKPGRDGVIAQLVHNDDTRRKQLFDQIRAYRETLFSREHQQTVLKPLIDQMQALLTGFGVVNVAAEIDSGWPNRWDISLRVCLAPPTRSTSSSTTPVPVCMPAILSRFRRAYPLRRISRSTTNRCRTTTTKPICGYSTTLGPENR